MSKKSFDQDDSKPFEYFKEVEAAKKQDKPGGDNLISSLRSDMLVTSSTAPAQKNIFQRINLKILFGILLTLFIIVLSWFLLAGPGRPVLEHNLALLLHTEATATPNQVVVAVPATPTAADPSDTPTPKPTIRPTSTPTTRIIASPTSPPLTATPTSSGCRDALSITLADVGQTMCVQGTVIETVERPNAFMVIFNKQPGSFYWVTYDLVWSQAEIDTCYLTTGTIKQLGSSPILIFNYSNLPEICP